VQRFRDAERVSLVGARSEPAGAGTIRADRPTVVTELAGFDEFYATHYSGLTVQLYLYFGDRQEAHDIAQEAFCRAYARWGAVSAYDDPGSWVRRVAWNLALSRWRRTRSALNFLRRHARLEPPAEGPSPVRVAIMTALAALPERQRRVLVLRYIGDFTVPEIAEREGVAEGTVKSWLHRARAALAAELDDPEGDQ
jgi:RNA polymerase sigma-70 factor (ECF subfamily)